MKKLLVPIVALIVISCDSETLNPANQVDVELSYEIPSFENTQDISETVKSLKSNNSSGRIESDFISFEDKYQEALSSLENIETEEEFYSLLELYKDYIILEDSTVKPVISDPTYRLISSPEKIYSSDGYIHKIIDNDHIIYTQPKFLPELVSAESVEDVKDENLTVVKYSGTKQELDNGRLASYCPNPSEAQARKDERGCKNDRRVKSRVTVNYLVSGNNYTPLATFMVIAEKKSSISCNWKVYSDTTIEWKDAWVDITYRVNTAGTIQNIRYGISAGNRSGWGYDETVFYPYLSTPYYGGSPLIEIDAVYMESSSRGVGNRWAVLNCN